MKHKYILFALIAWFTLGSSRLLAEEWIDTDGDGIKETLQLDTFVVNANDPESFDWEGYNEWCANEGLIGRDPSEFDSFTDFWEWIGDYVDGTLNGPGNPITISEGDRPAATAKALEAINQVAALSISSNKEHSGIIYRDPQTGAISYTSAESQNVFHTPLPAGKELIGIWHTHGNPPAGGNLFSNNDYQLTRSENWGVPNFVGTPNGGVYMIPAENNAPAGWSPQWVEIDTDPNTTFQGLNNPIVITAPSGG